MKIMTVWSTNTGMFQRRNEPDGELKNNLIKKKKKHKKIYNRRLCQKNRKSKNIENVKTRIVN